MLKAERLVGAGRYERSEGRQDTPADHYEQNFDMRASRVKLKMTKLRKLSFETSIYGSISTTTRGLIRGSAVRGERPWIYSMTTFPWQKKNVSGIWMRGMSMVFLLMTI